MQSTSFIGQDPSSKDKPKGHKPSKKSSIEDITYMSEVDAAMYRRAHPLTYLLSIGMVLAIAIFIGWASVAELDEVTRGEGQVESTQGVQPVQNLEGGILEAVLVKEGDIVEPGTVVARLRNQTAATNYRDALNRKFDAIAAIARLEAEMSGKPLVFPMEELNSLDVDNAETVLADQKSLYDTRRRKFESDVALLQSQSRQRSLEVQSLSARLTQARASRNVVVQQRELAKPLVERGSYSRQEYLNLENRVIELDGQVNSLTSDINKAQGAVQEAKDRIQAREAEERAQSQRELSEKRAELAALNERLALGEDTFRRTELVAHSRSVVKKVNISARDSVIQPKDTIMELVPLDDTLIVKTKIKPQDRGQIKPEDKAIVRISAYDSTIYGGIEGVVEVISPDTLQDNRTGEFYYEVLIRTLQNYVVVKGEKKEIKPGMTATVDIMTGKKTVLSYLLKPILRARQYAMTEK